MATGHLNVQHGLCWELWLAWVAVMLSISLIQAFYFTVCLPAEARLPGWGLAIVMPVLPVLGEPLDIFKDWLFIGLALSQRTWPSVMMAGTGVGILIASNVYMLRYHPKELAAGLLPVRAVGLIAWSGRPPENLMMKQTSPAKLAVAITEDLPQAGLQSLFVLVYGGSPIQHFFIIVSVLKALACLVLRATIMQNEGRFGDAYEALVVYYRLTWTLARTVLGENSTFALEARHNLGKSLSDLGRHAEALDVFRDVLKLAFHAEALDVFREVLAAKQHALGPTHPDTLRVQASVAISLRKNGRLSEALDVQREVLSTQQQCLGPTHPDSLRTEGNFGLLLVDLKHHAEALHVLQEVLAAKQEVLGPTHPSTLATQLGLATSLTELDRQTEAADVLKEVLAAQQQVLGCSHPATLDTQNSLAELLSGLCRVEAEALRAQVEGTFDSHDPA
ncbi:TSS [Symbiodinium pilosum]|uniref:TSS protein n=1 Tax=Symbiodinium pilosum TaxID=2952 RepID=A0A812TKM8_SYMPI|nr:TSS [Symbiodinium pilosum]